MEVEEELEFWGYLELEGRLGSAATLAAVVSLELKAKVATLAIALDDELPALHRLKQMPKPQTKLRRNNC